MKKHLEDKGTAKTASFEQTAVLRACLTQNNSPVRGFNLLLSAILWWVYNQSVISFFIVDKQNKSRLCYWISEDDARRYEARDSFIGKKEARKET